MDLRNVTARLKPDGYISYDLHIHCLPGTIDVLWKEFTRAGVQIPEKNGPVDRDYGIRDFTVIDPDGYEIIFGSPINKLNHKNTMAKYLISFPSAAMVLSENEWEAAGRDSHAVIAAAKAAGVYVFGGGIDEKVPPVLVSADGRVAEGGYPWAPPLNGGLAVFELPTREDAINWAARLAKACRCDQELRVFGFDPES